ncbi:hypothetical protein [Niveispirillum fermenti]|uniref:hypothetical protein n=1 Tax=Niveispirillum fermenti TaxID=1233113 RepID=UPI003A89ABBC
MKKLISALILSTLALFTSPALADIAALNQACGGLPDAPARVAGNSADDDAMRRYGAEMRDYTGRLMAYLTCLDEHPVSDTALASASYRRDVINHRRQVADRLEQDVSNFNAELRRFKSRQAQIASVD